MCHFLKVALFLPVLLCHDTAKNHLKMRKKQQRQFMQFMTTRGCEKKEQEQVLCPTHTHS